MASTMKQAYHKKQLNRLVNPEMRAVYYCENIDTDAINLSTAENILLLDYYNKHAFTPGELGRIEEKDIRYPGSVYGSDAYRESVAGFLSTQWGIEKLEKDHVFAVAGVSAALECLAFALFKPGDAVISPAPLWYGFPWSFQRPNLSFNHFPLKNAGLDRFELTLEDVKAGYYSMGDDKPSLLILTNPNNPLGVNYRPDLLEEIYDWVLNETQMHIISDEIYALSQIGDQSGFHSAFSLDAVRNAGTKGENRVHVVWGLAKDFGLSGFKVGFVLSKSEEVMQAMEGSGALHTPAWFSPFDSLKQYMLKALFLDEKGNANPKLAEAAMAEYSGNREGSLLEKQFCAAKNCLTEKEIEFFGGTEAAIFFWLDLREYLDKIPPDCKAEGNLLLYCNHDHEGNLEDRREDHLEAYIREVAQVMLIPGQRCFNAAPGYFRLCYTAEEEPKVLQGIKNLATALEKLD